MGEKGAVGVGGGADAAAGGFGTQPDGVSETVYSCLSVREGGGKILQGGGVIT